MRVCVLAFWLEHFNINIYLGFAFCSTFPEILIKPSRLFLARLFLAHLLLGTR